VLGANGAPVCSVYGDSTRAEECDINQALIRSAPELLELVRTARVIVESAGHMELSVRMWNAMAKADNLAVEEEDE
jgi:hypothetical protein